MLQTTDKHQSNTRQQMGEYKSSSAGRRSAREILLRGIRSVVASQKNDRLTQIITGTVDWKYLLALSDFQNVTPMIAHVLTQDVFACHIPAPYLEKFDRIYRDNVYRHVILSNELIKVLSLLEQSRIEVITLKGSVLAEQLYVNPETRSTTDVDLLVHEGDLTRVETLLLEIGYAPSTAKEDIEHPFHHAFFKQDPFPIMLELHWNLDDLRITGISLPDIWARASYREFQKANVRVISPEDTLIHLSTSLFRDNGQQLKYLCDITELLKSNQSNFDWEYVIKSAGSMGINTSIYYSLKWAQEFCEAPVPGAIITAFKPNVYRRWLIEFLLGWQTVFAPIRLDKIRIETSAIAQSLMMDRWQQSKAVLVKYHGDDTKTVWLRTLVWLPPVLGIALWINMRKFLNNSYYVKDNYISL